ncbi:Transport permease protein [uncultured Gammaproteobacteria bacterium]
MPSPGLINHTGLITLYAKEVRRFHKVFGQTIAAPVVTTLLFYAVFTLALGGAGRSIGSTPYLDFLAPGLVMMAMAQNSFANTSSSLIIAKIQGTIVDVLMPPLSPLELALGYVLGGITRGLLVGGVALLVLFPIAPFSIAHPGFVVADAVLATMMLSLLGLIGGIWSEKFDHIAAITNFVIAPASFLSGTFYSITTLPPLFRTVAMANPFFYMIDGFRYGFIASSDSSPEVGLVVLLVTNAALWAWCLRMLATGYKLKA